MPGLFDLTAQQGAMAQNAADDALETQGRLYEHNEGVKAQNWEEAGKLVTSLAGSYGKYRGAQRQQSGNTWRQPGIQQQVANEAAGRDPMDSGPPSSIKSVIGGTLRNMFSSTGDQ